MCVLVQLFSIIAFGLSSLMSVRAIDISWHKIKEIMKGVHPQHSKLSSRNEDQDLCIISFVTDFGKPLASHACSCFVPFSYIRYSGLVMGPRFAYWVKDNVSYNIICIICIIIYLCLYVYIYIYIYIYIYLYIKCKYIYVSFSIYISIYLYRVFE